MVGTALRDAGAVESIPEAEDEALVAGAGPLYEFLFCCRCVCGVASRGSPLRLKRVTGAIVFRLVVKKAG